MAPNSISLITAQDKWLVRIVENGDLAGEREFGLEEHANSFIAGQMVRLGLTEVLRLQEEEE
ncbi:hypothetical protein [Pararhizobium arenae]|uniref:hypothetical protein n=1 Tax=Pararhizobium arenae TaxID=1856850 RepID=UPI00094AD8DF|nr:hypothetical protein [Pararhizobium arenae]